MFGVSGVFGVSIETTSANKHITRRERTNLGKTRDGASGNCILLLAEVASPSLTGRARDSLDAIGLRPKWQQMSFDQMTVGPLSAYNLASADRRILSSWGDTNSDGRHNDLGKWVHLSVSNDGLGEVRK